MGTKLSALRSLLPKHANDNARMIVVGSQRPISSPTLSFQDVHPFEFSWLSPKQRRLLRISNMYISRSPNAERDATDGRTQTRSKRRKTRHITRCSQKDKCPRRTSGRHGTTLASGVPLFKDIRPNGSASVGVRMRPMQETRSCMPQSSHLPSPTVCESASVRRMHRDATSVTSASVRDSAGGRNTFSVHLIQTRHPTNVASPVPLSSSPTVPPRGGSNEPFDRRRVSSACSIADSVLFSTVDGRTENQDLASWMIVFSRSYKVYPRFCVVPFSKRMDLMTALTRNVEIALNPDRSFGRERVNLFFAQSPSTPHVLQRVKRTGVRFFSCTYLRQFSLTPCRPSQRRFSVCSVLKIVYAARMSIRLSLSLGVRLNFPMKRRSWVFLLFLSFAFVRHAVGQGTTV